MKKGLEIKESEWDKLVEAVKSNDINRVQSLLAATPSLINEKNNGWTALHYVALHGHEQVASMLIAKSPELLDAVDNNGYTALHIAAQEGNEQVVSMLIDRSPKLLNAVDNDSWNALHYAAGNGHEQVVAVISKAKDVLALQLKNLKLEENKVADKTANKSDFENKKFHYSNEKIHKILLAQLQNEKNVSVKLLDLSDPAKASVSEQQLRNFISSAIQGNKTLAIALHLRGESWASLVVKHIGNDNLQLIYNDPKGSAFTKELAVQKLISAIIEQNRNGDTTVTDLRQSQQNMEVDSGAFTVDNLVKIATARSSKKADLQKILSTTKEIHELKVRHSLIGEDSSEYSEHKFKKLLELSLKDQQVNIAPVTDFEDKASLPGNIQAAIKQVMDNGGVIVIPLSIEGRYWSGLVIRDQGDGCLQVIYSNPTGAALKVEKNSMILLKAITDVTSDIHMIDLKYKQDEDKQASGAFTIGNLIKLVLSDTDDFRAKDFQKLFATIENIDQLRVQHNKLLHDYTMPDLMPNLNHEAGSSISISERHEVFEQKGDWSEGKEKYPEPPAYEEADLVQMHVLGEDAEA